MRIVKLTNTDEVALVDDADFEAVNAFSWGIDKKGYVQRTVPAVERAVPYKQQLQKLHHFLMGRRVGFQVDHCDRNKKNCQRGNMRWATPGQNRMNSGKKRSGSSRFKGVSWIKNMPNRPWRAAICLRGKTIRLGHFVREEEAAQAYDKAAATYFGEFAKFNFEGLKGVFIIPYNSLARARCQSCGVLFDYDVTKVKRAPRVCSNCQTQCEARTAKARRERLKAGVLLHGAELSGLAIRSYREVAAIMDISPTAVHLLEQSALAKLRAKITKQNENIL